MYNNPHRFVHALLESAEDLKTQKLFKAMTMMHQGNQQSQAAPIQLVLGQQQAPQDNMMKKMMMKMLMKKMFKDQDDHDESPFGNMGSMKYGKDDDNSQQYQFFQNMMKQMNRNKRATDDLFELGDRLTEKLQQETEKWQAKLGNASCVLKELDIIDQNEDLDVNAMVQSIERGEWGRFMMFFQCEHEAKYKCCMNHDMKLKLEKSFGSLEELEEKTGLPEYQLLPMTMKLLNEQMDMFM